MVEEAVTPSPPGSVGGALTGVSAIGITGTAQASCAGGGGSREFDFDSAHRHARPPHLRGHGNRRREPADRHHSHSDGQSGSSFELTALSLLNALELKIEILRAEGSNSEIAEFHDLKRRVEEFLAANAKRDEAPIADTTLSIADGLRRLLMHENVRDIGLLGVGLSFCAAAGALHVSDGVMLAATAIAGGNKVADVLNAAASLVWGKGKG